MDGLSQKNILSGIVSMLQTKLILSLLLTLSFNTGLYASIPVIISQSTDTEACPGDTILFVGDSLDIVFQTNGHYNYQWYKNEAPLKDNKDTVLNIHNVDFSHVGSYRASISNLEDTLWTDPLNLHVFPPSGYFDTDTLQLCFGDSLPLISFGDYQNLWSTGDTTINIYVSVPGKYWVTLTDSAGFSLTDTTVILNNQPIELSGTYTDTQEFCSNLLHVVDDCIFEDTLILNPGTHVIFKGDYDLSIHILRASPPPEDSIIFQGFIDPTDQGRKGTVTFRGIDKWDDNEVRYARFSQLKGVNMFKPKFCHIRECDNVSSFAPVNCEYTNNSILRFSKQMDQCIVSENDSIFFHIDMDPIYKTFAFDCRNSIFEKNNSGLIWDESSYGSLSVAGNTFRENVGTLVKYQLPAEFYGLFISNNISQNLFADNEGDVLDFMGAENFMGISVYNNTFTNNQGLPIALNTAYYHISNNLILDNTTDHGPGAILLLSEQISEYGKTISNNTIIGNQGTSFSGIELTVNYDSVKFYLANNIFSGNTATESEYVIGLNKNYCASPIPLSLVHSAFDDTSKIVQVTNSDSECDPGEGLHIANNFMADPVFEDPALDNYRLSQNSPYINKGISKINNMSLSGSIDLDDNTRLFGSAIDIGAYEYIPEGFPEFIYVTPDTIGCFADSISLKALSNDHYAYFWYKNGQLIEGLSENYLPIATLSINDTGIYHASISNSSDTVLSEVIRVDFDFLPLITGETGFVEACVGDSALFSVTTNELLAPNYEWYRADGTYLGNSTNQYYFDKVLNSDSLYVTVNTACGKTQSDPMYLLAHPLPQPRLGNDTTLLQGETILLNPGDFEYYLWSDGSESSELEISGGDTIWVEVSNSFGCQARDTIILDLTLAVPSFIEYPRLKLYPNPSTDVLFIDELKLNPPYTVGIYTPEGILVKLQNFNGNGVMELNLDDQFKSGIYIIKISTNEGFARGTFVLE